jgi:hypothetical protein
MKGRSVQLLGSSGRQGNAVVAACMLLALSPLHIEINMILLVLFGIQNKILGVYWAALHRIPCFPSLCHNALSPKV